MSSSRKQQRKQNSPGAARSHAPMSCSQTAKQAYPSKAAALAAAGPGEDAERCARDRSHFHVVRKRGKGRNR